MKILISLDSQTEIKNADEKIIKLSEIQPGFYQTCYHTNPIPFYSLLWLTETGTFARRTMVDQAHEGLCYQKEI